jgi:phosphatidylglycerophosphate synthase
MRTLPGAGPPIEDAVILASPGAGRAVAGLPNLERITLTVLEADVRRVLILTPDVAASRSLLRAEAFSRAELSLVEAASEAEAEQLRRIAEAGRTFVVLHAQLAIDPHGVLRLVAAAQAQSEPGPLLLRVRRDPPHGAPYLGIRLDGTRAVALDAQAGDCLALAGVVPAMAALSLSGGGAAAMEALAAETSRWLESGPVQTFQPAGGHLSLLGDLADYESADAALVRSAGKETDGIVSRTINRRVSTTLSRWLVRTRVTPNALTLVTLAVGLAAGWALAQGGEWSFVAGTLLYHLNSTIDGCDGEIARIKFLTSRFGAWADTVSDQVANIVFALGVPIGLYEQSGSPLYLWLGAVLGVSLAATLAAVFVHTRSESGAAHFSNYGRSVVSRFPRRSLRGRALHGLSLICRRDFYALFFLVLAVVGAESWILYLLVAGVIGHLASFLLPRTAPTRCSGSTA